MKLVSILAIFLFINFSFISNKTKIKITNKSEVIIRGKSNVNSFECKYNSDFIEEVIDVVLTKQNDKIFLENAKIYIKSKGFDCAHKMITKDFKSILKASEYSHIQLEVKEVQNQNEILTAKVRIKIADVKKDYSIPISFDSNFNNVKGQLKINIKDFNLKAPKKLLGMVIVNDNVDIYFNLYLEY